MTGHDRQRTVVVSVPFRPAAPHSRATLRLISIAWAVLAALVAAALAAALAWARSGAIADALLRAGGSGFFYGLLAFHLQRVDPDDGHLQAGLVGAVCGLHSLATPIDGPLSPADRAIAGLPTAQMMRLLPGLLEAWLPLWLPLIGSAVALRGARRWLPGRLETRLCDGRPCSAPGLGRGSPG